MRNFKKIIPSMIFIVFVTGLWYQLKTNWVLALYALVLALYPSEIKALPKRLSKVFLQQKRVLVTCAYIFRIHYANLYLLIEDHDKYYPVTGIYRYNSKRIDIARSFEGEYAGSSKSLIGKLEDLYLKIPRTKLPDFNLWFKSERDRENSSNLCRAFVEKLIDTQLLPAPSFRYLRYRYIGSVDHSTTNSNVGMDQICHFDIFDLRLTSEQLRQVDQLRKSTGNIHRQFVFATEDDINNGVINFEGTTYHIADTARYILISQARDLDQLFYLPKDIRANTNEASGSQHPSK